MFFLNVFAAEPDICWFLPFQIADDCLSWLDLIYQACEKWMSAGMSRHQYEALLTLRHERIFVEIDKMSHLPRPGISHLLLVHEDRDGPFSGYVRRHCFSRC